MENAENAHKQTCQEFVSTQALKMVSPTVTSNIRSLSSLDVYKFVHHCSLLL